MSTLHRPDRPDASSVYRPDRPNTSPMYHPDPTCARYITRPADDTKLPVVRPIGTIRGMSNLEARPYNVDIPSTYSQDASSESF